MQCKRLKVQLISHTPNPLDVIYFACRQCYYSGGIAELLDKSVSYEKKKELVKKVFSSGHESPLEHVSFTFAIEGISRACSHQLVRHRLASYSQQSQRYVELGNLPFIIPPVIEENEEARKIFIDLISQVELAYRELVDILSENSSGDNVIQEARYILPNACETRVVMTMNARELIHFFEVRCCMRAQWEIRCLAEAMLERVKLILPEIFDSVGAKCLRLGYCPEEYSCGRYPKRTEVINK